LASKSNCPVDALDFCILAHLRDDGRKSFTAITGLVDMSVGTVSHRIVRMLSDDTLNIVARIAGEFHLQVDVMCRATAISQS
jgi:DNA-binding Lrp family transcriptional regulator